VPRPSARLSKQMERRPHASYCFGKGLRPVKSRRIQPDQSSAKAQSSATKSRQPRRVLSPKSLQPQESSAPRVFSPKSLQPQESSARSSLQPKAVSSPRQSSA
jgi:hypothetical protein